MSLWLDEAVYTKLGTSITKFLFCTPRVLFGNSSAYIQNQNLKQEQAGTRYNSIALNIRM